jgi:hypothetical protein
LGQRVLADEALVELARDAGHLAEKRVPQPLHLLRQIARVLHGRDAVELIAEAQARLRYASGIHRLADRCLPLGVQGDPVLDGLAVAGAEGCTLLGEGLAKGDQLLRHRLGAILRDGVAAQEAHAAGRQTRSACFLRRWNTFLHACFWVLAPGPVLGSSI